MTENKEEFRIKDLEGAAWALKEISALEAKEKEKIEYVGKEISKLKLWLDDELRSSEREKSYFQGLLTEYYLRNKKEDKKFKLSTPYGKVSLRKTEKYIYEDEQAIIDYCNMNEIDAIKVTETLDKNAFKKVCKGGVNLETGEVVPGVRVETVENINIKITE